MAKIRARKFLNTVKSVIDSWGMLFLNLFMSLLIAVVSYSGLRLDKTLDLINNNMGLIKIDVSSIDTRQQLNSQHIKTLFHNDDRLELADSEMKRQIKILRDSLK